MREFVDLRILLPKFSDVYDQLVTVLNHSAYIH